MRFNNGKEISKNVATFDSAVIVLRGFKDVKRTTK
jgi:hypothetical protein